MRELGIKKGSLSDRDLDFIVGEAAPEFEDKERLKALIREDEDFRRELVGHDRVFRRVMEEEGFLRISPTVYFEILLRRAIKELAGHGHTLEKSGAYTVAVLDSEEVAGLFSEEPVGYYLADMLSSFTRVENYVMSVRIGKGLYRRVRFNNMDVEGMKKWCDAVDEEYRLWLYKRVADICLFILGVFPEYARSGTRYPLSGELRPGRARRGRKNAEAYREEGVRFYKLAAEHPAASEFELSDMFRLLHEKFNTARKPLNFIAEAYLRNRKRRVFAAG